MAAGTQNGRAETPKVLFLPLRAFGPADEHGNQPLQYWPILASDLYNWKTHNPPFSENPWALTNLFDSLLFSHQPTWDDCQQRLQVLFTMEEMQHILLKARKNVPGINGRPSLLPTNIDAGFPLTRPE